MRIVIPVDDNQKDMCLVFARTPMFLVYDDEDDSYTYIDNEAKDAEGGAGVKAAQIVVDNDADILISFRCGENANEVFKMADVKVYKAVSNIAKENIEMFKRHELEELTKFHGGYHGIR